MACGLFLFSILLSLYRAKGIKQFWTPGFLGRFLHKDRFIGVTTMEASSAGTSATTSTCRHEGVLITFEGLQLSLLHKVSHQSECCPHKNLIACFWAYLCCKNNNGTNCYINHWSGLKNYYSKAKSNVLKTLDNDKLQIKVAGAGVGVVFSICESWVLSSEPASRTDSCERLREFCLSRTFLLCAYHFLVISVLGPYYILG